jgi:hypothetical protein
MDFDDHVKPEKQINFIFFKIQVPGECRDSDLFE